MAEPFQPWEVAFRLVFVLYCTTIGLVFLYMPWTSTWDVLVSHLPAGLRFFESPFLRSMLSGFGAVHLVWVLNELDEVLRAGQPADGHETPGS